MNIVNLSARAAHRFEAHWLERDSSAWLEADPPVAEVRFLASPFEAAAFDGAVTRHPSALAWRTMSSRSLLDSVCARSVKPSS